MSDLLIIRNKCRFNNDSYKLIYADLLDQKANGLILLPPGLEVVSTDKDVEIQPDCKWIPCSERLPEKSTCCIVTAISKVTGNRIIDFCYFVLDHWVYESTVVAWMPLPEVYKGE